MSYLIVSDLHLGLRRQTCKGAGATTQSLMAFNHFQFEEAEKLLLSHPERDLIILGDLFAEFSVEYSVLRRSAEILSQRSGVVYLVEGNHDSSRDQSKKSAISRLAWLLGRLSGGPLVVFASGSPAWVEHHTVVIVPHLVNQEAFDAALAEIPKGATLLTHCNFDNPFAAEKAHSLNLSPAQAAAFSMVISGHEHNRSHKGNMFMLGSPYPCNIGEAEVDHGYHLWDGPDHEPEFVKTWGSAESGARASQCNPRAQTKLALSSWVKPT